MRRRTAQPSVPGASFSAASCNTQGAQHRKRTFFSGNIRNVCKQRRTPVRRSASHGGLFWTRVSGAMQLGSSRPRRKNHGPLLTHCTYLESSGGSAAFTVLFTAEGCLHRVQWTRRRKGRTNERHRSPFASPFPPSAELTRIVDICQCGRCRHANTDRRRRLTAAISRSLAVK